MSGVAIYLEGGGDTSATKTSLRQGMDEFVRSLKTAARERGLLWKLVACGGRQEAYQAFINSHRDTNYSIRLLIVDAEAEVTNGPREHLRNRDQWNLTAVPETSVHLMVQTMETWIIADQAALMRYYGADLLVNALPQTTDLETVAKVDIARALAHATERTSKGRYHKIRHATDLLKQVSPQTVQARCPSCRRMFATVSGLIESAR